MKFVTTAATMLALVFLLTIGAPRASADLVNTLYCVSGSCSTTAPSGAYWTVETDMKLLSATTFDFKLTVTANGGAGGFLQDFSGQYFYNGSQLTDLQWVTSNGWTDLEASKAGNSGTCQGNTPGAFCGSSVGTSDLALSSTPLVFELTGSYTGTVLDTTGMYHLQIAASTVQGPIQGNQGGNAFAISQDFTPTTVPDGGLTLTLLGGVLVGLETLRRKIRA